MGGSIGRDQRQQVMRPRLLIIGPTPPPFHGVAVAIRLLLDSAIAERFSLRHLDLADRRGIQHVNKPDVHDVWLFVKQWVGLLQLLLTGRPCITYLVLSQTTIGFMRDTLLLLPAWMLGSRLVLHLHGGYLGEWYAHRSFAMQWLVRTVLRRATRVIVLGETFRHIFTGILPGHKIAVVPNGIEMGSPAPAARHSCGKEAFTVLHLGTLSHLKGTLILLRAIPLVLARQQHVKFTLAGPWSYPEDQAWAEDFIQHHNLSGHVSLPGQIERSEKDTLFAGADLFVFPGVQQEGQPLVALEAMAAGLPVVFTNRGCLRETIVDGEAGIEIPIDDPNALADAIIWFFHHPDEREAMGRRGHERVRTHFTKAHHISKMIQVFTEADKAA